MAKKIHKWQGGFWYGRKGPRARRRSRQAHRGTTLRMEPLEARHLLSAGSWGVAEGGVYDDMFSDAAYAPDGSCLYALSVVQETERGPSTTNLSAYAIDGQELFSLPILNGLGSFQRLQVADNGDIFVAGQYQAGTSVSDEALPLPVFGGSDIVVARFSMDTGSPDLAWWRAFGSAEDDRFAAIELIDNGPDDLDVCLVGNFGQTLSLWDEDEPELPNTSGADYGTFAVVADAVDGHLQCATELNDSGTISISDAAVTGTGELYVVGSFRGRNVQIGDDSFSEHQRISQAIIAKYQMGEAAIEPLWAYQIADAGRSYARSVAPGSNGTVFVAGNYRGDHSADFGITSLPSTYDDPAASYHGFLVQIAEDTPGQPENAWVRQLAGGDVLPGDLDFTDDTLYVACGFDRKVDLDLDAGIRGDLVSRGSGDVAVAELQLEVNAGRVVGDELGRVWQMEYADDDVPDLDVNRYPGQAMIDVSPDGRVAIATASSSEIALTPVGAMITQGGHDGMLLDIAPDYPLVEVTTTEPVLGQSAAGLAATAQYPFVNADLNWVEWQLWQLHEGGGRTWVQDNNNADPAQMTFIDEQPELGGRYEAVITVEDAIGNRTECSYIFDVGLDPPENLAATVATHDTVTVTWDLPATVEVGDGFVIEADCTTGHPFYWDLVGQVTVTDDDAAAGKMSATVGMTRILYRWQEGLRYRVRSYRGTPEAMDLLSPAAVVYVPEPGTEPTPPEIDSLSAAPNPVVQGADLTLTASGVTDDSAVARVDFYHDSNDSGVLEPTADALVGQDADGSNGWSATAAADYVLGSQRFFAVATDDGGLTSDVVETMVSVTDGSSISTEIYVWDIRFETQGVFTTIVVDVRQDSNLNGLADGDDTAAAGAAIDIALDGYEPISGFTDSDGIFRSTSFKKLADGTLADVTRLELNGFDWNALLDQEDDSNDNTWPDEVFGAS
jgi:hypothetical protein